MKVTDVPAYIYNVGELKAEFETVRAARVKIMQSEPLPQGAKSLTQGCAAQDLAIQVTTSLALLREHFKDTDYVGLLAVPCELSHSADQSSKPFHHSYVRNDYRVLTKAQAEAFPQALRSLAKS